MPAGILFRGDDHCFDDNQFVNNLNIVAISAPGAGRVNVWRGNVWDEYQGFAGNHDTMGDTPHEARLFADRIWMRIPMATFFRNSLALALLDFLEHPAPFLSPHLALRDPAPRMR